jgi:hypothetical protein
LIEPLDIVTGEACNRKTGRSEPQNIRAFEQSKAEVQSHICTFHFCGSLFLRLPIEEATFKAYH